MRADGVKRNCGKNLQKNVFSCKMRQNIAFAALGWWIFIIFVKRKLFFPN